MISPPEQIAHLKKYADMLTTCSKRVTLTIIKTTVNISDNNNGRENDGVQLQG